MSRSKAIPSACRSTSCSCFSANPEDYTARGKIITPLKDRIGSEIVTHYPETVETGIAITRQEAWTDRGAHARARSGFHRRSRSSASRSRRAPTSASTGARACRSACRSASSRTSSRTPNVARSRPASPKSSHASPTSTPRFPRSPASSSSSTKARSSADLRSRASSSAAPPTRRFASAPAVPTPTRSSCGSTPAARCRSRTTSRADSVVKGFEAVPTLARRRRRKPGLATRGDAPVVAAACELVLESLVARRKISRSDEGRYGRAPSEKRRRPGEDYFGGMSA